MVELWVLVHRDGVEEEQSEITEHALPLTVTAEGRKSHYHMSTMRHSDSKDQTRDLDSPHHTHPRSHLSRLATPDRSTPKTYTVQSISGYHHICCYIQVPYCIFEAERFSF